MAEDNLDDKVRRVSEILASELDANDLYAICRDMSRDLKSRLKKIEDRAVYGDCPVPGSCDEAFDEDECRQCLDYFEEYKIKRPDARR